MCACFAVSNQSFLSSSLQPREIFVGIETKDYMSQFGWQDCPADVKEQIELLIRGLRRQLEDNLIGVYLHGSLAMGCFNPLRSDIDLLVVVRQRMTVETKRGLARIILDASRNPAPIEISFLSPDDLQSWRHPTPYDFHYSEDWREDFERERAGGDWEKWYAAERTDADLAAHITALNHRGACLYGRSIKEVFPSVPEQDFVDSILADVLSAKYGLNGAAAQIPVYAVLNACRTLAFLRDKSVLSKEEGGRWALANLPAGFHKTIIVALDEYRSGRNEQSRLPQENLADFSAFMKNEIGRARG